MNLFEELQDNNYIYEGRNKQLRAFELLADYIHYDEIISGTDYNIIFFNVGKECIKRMLRRDIEELIALGVRYSNGYCRLIMYV